MRRFTRSFRTRKNVRHASALRTQFLRELSREAEALMKQLTEQFNQSLQTQLTQLFQSIAPGDSPALPATGTQPGTIGSIGQLLATGARLLASRPRTSRNTQETSRSVDVTAQFKLSQAQALAEAQTTLGKGDKNL